MLLSEFCDPLPPQCSLTQNASFLVSSGVPLVYLYLCTAVHLLPDRMSGPYEQGGGEPFILTYLLWFQSPHIPTYTFTHPVPKVVAAALRMGVFSPKDPGSHIFLHITLYLKQSVHF